MLHVCAALLIPLAMVLGAAYLCGSGGTAGATATGGTAAGGKASGGTASLRESLVWAALATAVWVAAGCEVLSLFHALSFPMLLVWWLAPCVALSIGVWRRRRAIWGAVRAGSGSDLATKVMVGAAGLVLVGTLCVAVLTPPTTVDVLAYHLPRQVQWMQHSGVQHYATQDLRELEMPPLAEFAGVQLMILAHGDWPANLVQWAGYAVMAVLASLVAREMGAKGAGQALAAVLALAIPAAMTQSVQPKNDVVVAALALATLWPAVRIWVTKRCSWGEAVGLAVAAGLMLLTKGTAYFVLLPLGVFVIAAMFRAVGVRAVRMGAVMAAVVVAINAGHAVRNYRAFGNPTHLPESRGGYALANATFGPSAIASNVVRNVALLVSLPDEGYRRSVRDCVVWIHGVLGISVDDERTTWGSAVKFDMYEVWYSDGYNPAPIHVVAYAGVLVGLVVAGVRRRIPAAWPVHLIPIAAFVVFCVVIRWQPWHNRLFIPFVALAAPSIGSVVGARARWLAAPLGLASLVAALTAFVDNRDKLLTGPNSVLGMPRERAMFATMPHYADLTKQLVQYLEQRRPGSIGLVYQDQMVYVLLRPLAFGPLESIRLVPVRRRFGPEIPEATQPPDLVIVWHDDVTMRREFVFKGVRYAAVGAFQFTSRDGKALDFPSPFVIMDPVTQAGGPAR